MSPEASESCIAPWNWFQVLTERRVVLWGCGAWRQVHGAIVEGNREPVRDLLKTWWRFWYMEGTLLWSVGTFSGGRKGVDEPEAERRLG